MIWASVDELAADSCEFRRRVGSLPTLDQLIAFATGVLGRR